MRQTVEVVQSPVRLVGCSSALEWSDTYLRLCNRTRCDNIGGHATRTILERDTVRQSIDTSLGDRHVGLERHTPVVNSCADEDDSTTSSDGRWLNWTDSELRRASSHRDTYETCYPSGAFCRTLSSMAE